MTSNLLQKCQWSYVRVIRQGASGDEPASLRPHRADAVKCRENRAVLRIAAFEEEIDSCPDASGSETATARRPVTCRRPHMVLNPVIAALVTFQGHSGQFRQSAILSQNCSELFLANRRGRKLIFRWLTTRVKTEKVPSRRRNLMLGSWIGPAGD
jgi:hypothetical protein